MSKISFRGIMPALITPIDARGRVLVKTVERLVEEQLAAGVDGFYVTGGTGEGVLLSMEQRREMVEAVIAANRHRGKVIVQVGAFHFEDVLTLTRHATDAGAEGVSSVLPSLYFNYSMEETEEYYKRIAGETSLPLILYAQVGAAFPNVNALLEKLLVVPNIIGVKDTRGNYYQMWQLKQLAGGDINVINGPDESLICGLTMGADGGIGTTYNVMPERFTRLYQAFQKGDISKAREEQTGINHMIGLIIKHGKGYTIRAVKEILRLKGHETGVSLAPAREMTEEERKELRLALESVGYFS
ncbi:MAG: dihydrodipicolinate synthase family protein [Victivallales bacterium]|nr:dihydrodipicolinate synthase family protein [Victivallales bacterium]